MSHYSYKMKPAYFTGGWGLVVILKNGTDYLHRYLLLIVPIVFNLFAILIGHLYVEDNCGTFNEDYRIWLRPNYLFKCIIDLFKNKCKVFLIVLATLIICQSVINIISTSFMWCNNDYMYFSVIKMLKIYLVDIRNNIILFYITMILNHSRNLNSNDLRYNGILYFNSYVEVVYLLYLLNNKYMLLVLVTLYTTSGQNGMC
ncbi:hypothetical protein QTP88_009223 [Uroleucon formosanum]